MLGLFFRWALRYAGSGSILFPAARNSRPLGPQPARRGATRPMAHKTKAKATAGAGRAAGRLCGMAEACRRTDDAVAAAEPDTFDGQAAQADSIGGSSRDRDAVE